MSRTQTVPQLAADPRDDVAIKLVAPSSTLSVHGEVDTSGVSAGECELVVASVHLTRGRCNGGPEPATKA